MDEILEQIPEWETLNPAQLVSALGETVIGDNPQRWKLADLVAMMPPEDIRTVLRAVSNSQDDLVQISRDVMTAEGLPLNTDLAQGLIDSLNIPVPLKAGLKKLGRPEQTRWSSLGGQGDVPKVADVRAAQDRLLLRRDWTIKLNETIHPAEANGDRAAFIAALRAVADELEA